MNNFDKILSEMDINVLKDYIDLNPYAIVIYDKEGTFLYQNKAHFTLHQSTPPPDYNIFEDPYAKSMPFYEDWKTRLQRGETYYTPEIWYNASHIYPDVANIDLCIKTVIFSLKDSQRKIQNYIFIYENVTERKKAEQELEKERNTLKNIIELNPYGIQIFDNEGYHIGHNKAFINLFKTIPPEGISVFTDPIHEKTGTDKGFRKVQNGEIIFYSDNWYNPHPELSDNLICHNVAGFPIFDGEGNVEKMVFMYEDITEKKLAELQLEELKKKLEIRVKERTFKLESSEKKFKKAYERANCYKGVFTHDISNIFQIISNSFELCQKAIEKEIDKEALKELYETMEHQINRGKKMIFNIKNLSDIEDTEMPIEEKLVKPYLDNAISFVKENFHNREIEIAIQAPAEELKVLANDLLLDIFENVLINSIRHNNNPKAEIRIIISESTENDKSFIKFNFIDNGIGIEDSRKKDIFKKNYKNIREHKGMGLGLSLVSEILDLYKGKIWVEDQVRGDYTKGSNFIFLIPKVIR